MFFVFRDIGTVIVRNKTLPAFIRTATAAFKGYCRWFGRTDPQRRATRQVHAARRTVSPQRAPGDGLSRGTAASRQIEPPARTSCMDGWNGRQNTAGAARRRIQAFGAGGGHLFSSDRVGRRTRFEQYDVCRAVFVPRQPRAARWQRSSTRGPQRGTGDTPLRSDTRGHGSDAKPHLSPRRNGRATKRRGRAGHARVAIVGPASAAAARRPPQREWCNGLPRRGGVDEAGY